MLKRLDVLAVVAAVATYTCNSYFWSFDSVLPYGFAHYHLNDLCGGVLFPAYVNLVVNTVRGEAVITTYRRAILLGVGCSLVWEVLAPIFLSNSTADPLDAIAYVTGTLAYTACYRLTKRRQRKGGGDVQV